MLRLLRLLIVLIARSFCFRRDLLLENLALRQQLDVAESRDSGVYLWTVPLQEGHLIYYVGETGNPMQLVEIKGISKRRKRPLILTLDQFFLGFELVPQPYRTMVVLAICSGVRAEEAGITKWVGFHSFRHTYSTLLKANGEDVKVVQELMRHANISTTMNVCTKALTPAKREAQSRVVDVLLDRSRKSAKSAVEDAA
jgi:hypothetical protein